jgi:hypothetical protein
MPTFPDRHLVLVRKEPKIVLLAYADVEHGVFVYRSFHACVICGLSSLRLRNIIDVEYST